MAYNQPGATWPQKLKVDAANSLYYSETAQIVISAMQEILTLSHCAAHPDHIAVIDHLLEQLSERPRGRFQPDNNVSLSDLGRILRLQVQMRDTRTCRDSEKIATDATWPSTEKDIVLALGNSLFENRLVLLTSFHEIEAWLGLPQTEFRPMTMAMWKSLGDGLDADAMAFMRIYMRDFHQGYTGLQDDPQALFGEGKRFLFRVRDEEPHGGNTNRTWTTVKETVQRSFDKFGLVRSHKAATTASGLGAYGTIPATPGRGLMESIFELAQHYRAIQTSTLNDLLAILSYLSLPAPDLDVVPSVAEGKRSYNTVGRILEVVLDLRNGALEIEEGLKTIQRFMRNVRRNWTRTTKGKKLLKEIAEEYEVDVGGFYLEGEGWNGDAYLEFVTRYRKEGGGLSDR